MMREQISDLIGIDPGPSYTRAMEGIRGRQLEKLRILQAIQFTREHFPEEWI